MAIYDFELMHGAVLTRICRNERPLSMTLIETSEHRSAYLINDVVLYIKHSTSARSNRGGTVWQFTFQARHIQDLHEFDQQRQLYLAFVCGARTLDDDMHIAFLHPHQIAQCLDLNKHVAQSVSVEYKKRHNLRIGSTVLGREQIQIKQGALENWEVPGR